MKIRGRILLKVFIHLFMPYIVLFLPLCVVPAFVFNVHIAVCKIRVAPSLIRSDNMKQFEVVIEKAR